MAQLKDLLVSGDARVVGTIYGTVTNAEKATKDASGNTITSTYAKLASPALTGTPTAPTATAGTNTTQIATTAFVTTAVSGVTGAMVFKGTVGTGGTAGTALPTTGVKVGDTYKIVTAGTYASQAAKVGDLFIATATTPTWAYVPSGDDAAVTQVTAGAGLNTTSADSSSDGGNITTTGTLYLTKTAVTPGTYQGITVDKYGRITGAENKNYTSNTGTITKVQANGTDVASSGTANIPAATTGAYGVTKLSSSTSSTSEALAATPKAVKTAYDLANGKIAASDITITPVQATGATVGTIKVGSGNTITLYAPQPGNVSTELATVNQTYYLTGVKETAATAGSQIYNTRLSNTFTGLKYQTSTSAAGGSLFVDDREVTLGLNYEIS